MNTTKIFQNSWNLMLRYRSLWIFGVILALTTTSFGSALWFRSSENQADRTLVFWDISPNDQAWVKENFGLDIPLNYTLKFEDLTFRLDDPMLSRQEKTRLLVITISIMLVLLTLLTIVLVLRYTAGAALIIMVNDKYDNDTQYRARKGWSLGFSTRGVKLFLIDLVVIPLLLIFTVLIFLPALLPLFIAISGTPAGITIGLLLMLSLTLVSTAALIVMWIVGLVTLQLAYRASCLEGLGVFASIWRGFRLMRAQLRGIGLSWIIITGLELVFPLLVAPVFILLAAASLAISGLLALILGMLLALVLAKGTAWSIAIIVGLLLLGLGVVVPMTLFNGLREVFINSAWTLTFKEAVNQQSIEETPAVNPPLPQAGVV